MAGRKFLRLFGRILIITLLLTSAILKLSKPLNYQTPFKNTYTKIKNISPVFSFLPPVEKLNPYMGYLIAGIGIAQALTALFVLFGDRIGGYFFIVAVTISQIATNGHALTQILKFTSIGKILQMRMFLCLLGVGFLLCDIGYIRKKAKDK